MTRGACGVRLGDGRLHLQHGPIDLVIAADAASGTSVEAAYQAAWRRFQGVLQEIVDDLTALRRPLRDIAPVVRGAVPARMVAAAWPHRAVYVTPMAAVAGAVADDILLHMRSAALLDRACVNNGGDIALWVASGRTLRIGIAAGSNGGEIEGTMEIDGDSGVGGVATSGWRGRSLSLGIADAVTVLAGSAAQADVAATLVANAVDADHPGIRRMPADAVREDTDLGTLPVTVDVGPLDRRTIAFALDRGVRRAEALRARGELLSAVLRLCGSARVVERSGATTGHGMRVA